MKRNETLAKIASKIEISPNRLYEINSKIISPKANFIQVGTILRYPLVSKMHCFRFIDATYKVNTGDILEKIAKQLKVNNADLYEWNKQTIPNTILTPGIYLNYEYRVRENMWG